MLKKYKVTISVKDPIGDKWNEVVSQKAEDFDSAIEKVMDKLMHGKFKHKGYGYSFKEIIEVE